MSTAACNSAVEPIEEPPLGLALLSADRVAGVEATYRDEEGSILYLSARPHGGVVESQIAMPGNVVVTRLSIPDSTVAAGEEIIPAIRAAAEQLTAEVTPELEIVIGEALAALYQETALLEDATVRFALLFHEEVLAARALGEGYNGVPCAVFHEQAMGTVPFHTADLHEHTVLRTPKNDQKDLICWSCWCDMHDNACMQCDHWYCGWECCVGTAANGCGGNC